MVEMATLAVKESSLHLLGSRMDDAVTRRKNAVACLGSEGN